MAHFSILISFCAVVLFIRVYSTKTTKSNSIILDVTDVVKDLLQNDDKEKADEADKAFTRFITKNIKKRENYLMYYQTDMTNNSHSEIQEVINIFDMLKTNLSSFHPKLLLSVRDTTEQPENVKDAEYIVKNYANIINLIADHSFMVVGLSFDAGILETLCDNNKKDHEYESKQPVKAIIYEMRNFIRLKRSSHTKNKKLKNILKLGYEIGINYQQCRDHIKNKNNADFLVIKIPLNGNDNYFVESYGLFKENLENKMSEASIENKTVLIKFNLKTSERSLHANKSQNSKDEEVYDQIQENLLNMAKDEIANLDARTVRRYENLMIRYILHEWTRQDVKERKVVINLQGYPYYEDTDLFESWKGSPDLIPYINNFPILRTTGATQYHDMLMKDVASTGLSAIMIPGDLWDSMYRRNESFTSCNSSNLCRPKNVHYLIKNEDQLSKILQSGLITRKNEIEVKSVVFSIKLNAPIRKDWENVIHSFRNTNVTPACQIETKVFKSTSNSSTCKNPNACDALLILHKRVGNEFDGRCKSMKNIPSKIIFTETVELDELRKDRDRWKTFVNNIMKRLDSFVIAREILLKEFPDKKIILQFKGHYDDEGESLLMTLYCNDFAEKVGQFYEVILNWAWFHEFSVIMEPNEKGYDSPLTWKQLVTPSSTLHSAMQADPVFVRRSYNRTNVFGMWTKGMNPCLPKTTMGTINTTTINFDNDYSGITLKLNLRKGNDPLSPEEIQILLLFSFGKFSSVEISLNNGDDLISLKLIFSLSNLNDNLKLNACHNKTLYLRLPKHCTKMDFKEINEIVTGFKNVGLYVNIHATTECLNSTIVSNVVETEMGQEFENCSDLVSSAAINEVHPLTELSYIICSTDQVLAHNNNENHMQDYLQPHLYLKKLLQHFYPNLKRIHFRLNPKLSGSTPKEQLSNLMMFLSDVNNYAQGYNIHYFVLPAFSTENNSENQTENLSFWKINDYKELTDLSVYVDCQSDLLNKKPWVPELVKDDTWMYTLIAITVLLVIFGLITTFVFWKRRSQRLSKLEIQQFHSGHQVTLKKAVDERKNNTYTVNIFDGLVFQKDFEISKEEITLHENVILGHGKFSTVHLATMQNIKKIAAVKLSNKRCSSAGLKGMLSEVKMLCYLGDHTNIVRFIGCYTKEIEKGVLWIVTELCEGGTLQAFLRTTRNNNRNTNFIDTKVLIQFSLEIASGMAYISKQKIIHGDLCTRSVLLDAEGEHCKIYGCGGLWRKMGDYRKCTKKNKEPSNWQWMAHETLKRMTYSMESDVWGYGVTVWEIFNLGDIPYPKVSWSSKFVDDLGNGMRLPTPLLASEEFFDVIQDCWNLEPKDRPDFSKLVVQLNNILSSEDDDD